MTETYPLKNLLTQVHLLTQHQQEMERIKGESFNVFSILGMEHLENATHSAFLGELLDPEGSHLKGCLFLQLFLETIGCDHLHAESCELKLEKHIGWKHENDKSSGRIDLFIIDKNHNSISIENKIYANDQERQLERYYYYNHPHNKVFYLNLSGKQPSKVSTGDLSEEQYQVLSYKDDILTWLDKCLKESADTPILRESIKQYMILLKKLTNTMNKENEGPLFELILSHMEEANYIVSNFNNALNRLREEIRQLILAKLKSRLEPDFVVEAGNPSHYAYSQIWIRVKGYESRAQRFGLESFTSRTHYNNYLFAGTFNEGGTKINYPGQRPLSSWWPDSEPMDTFEGYKVDLTVQDTLMKLHKDPEFLEKFCGHVATFTESYVKRELPKLLQFYKSSATK